MKAKKILTLIFGLFCVSGLAFYAYNIMSTESNSSTELIDFAMRTGAPLEVVENLQALEDEGESYDTIEEIWPDYPQKEDFFFNEDEY